MRGPEFFLFLLIFETTKRKRESKPLIGKYTEKNRFRSYWKFEFSQKNEERKSIFVPSEQVQIQKLNLKKSL